MPAKASDIREMSYYLSSASTPHQDALLKTHGHGMTPDEMKNALGFINSLQWDRSQKAFVTKTLH